jgi:hypothetical protein
VASIEEDSKLKIVSAANRIGLPFEEFAKGTLIWCFEKSYADNIAANPDMRLERPHVEPVRTWFLDWELDSPFGPASSVLTADRFRICFLMNRWNHIATTKSLRTRAYAPREPRNLAFCAVKGGEVGLAERQSGIDVDIFPDFERPSLKGGVGLLTRFDAPSAEPEKWKEDVCWVLAQLGYRQLLVVSLLPTDWAGGGRVEDVRADLFLGAAEARDAGARVVEINVSYPTVLGSAVQSWRDPRFLKALCTGLRERFPELRFLLKLGPANDGEALEVVRATCREVHGYSLINALPCHGNSKKSFFDRAAGSFSGPSLLKLGLSSVRAVRRALEELNLSEHVIIGVGGVHEPVNVMDYLEAGATVVQAASVFFEDTLFGAKVLGALVRRGDTEPRGPDELREAIQEHTLRAIMQVSHHRPEISFQRVQQIGFELLARHERELKQEMQRGPWLVRRAPSVFDLAQQIENRLGERK